MIRKHGQLLTHVSECAFFDHFSPFIFADKFSSSISLSLSLSLSPQHAYIAVVFGPKTRFPFTSLAGGSSSSFSFVLPSFREREINKKRERGGGAHQKLYRGECLILNLISKRFIKKFCGKLGPLFFSSRLLATNNGGVHFVKENWRKTAKELGCMCLYPSCETGTSRLYI